MLGCPIPTIIPRQRCYKICEIKYRLVLIPRKTNGRVEIHDFIFTSVKTDDIHAINHVNCWHQKFPALAPLAVVTNEDPPGIVKDMPTLMKSGSGPIVDMFSVYISFHLDISLSCDAAIELRLSPDFTMYTERFGPVTAPTTGPSRRVPGGT